MHAQQGLQYLSVCFRPSVCLSYLFSATTQNEVPPTSLTLHRLDFKSGDFRINAGFISYVVKTKQRSQYVN